MILALSTSDIVLMMNLDMDPKCRLGHFDTMVSPTSNLPPQKFSNRDYIPARKGYLAAILSYGEVENKDKT